MKTNYYNKYSFMELLEAATAPNAEQIDIDTLGAWCNDYGSDLWNGEKYDVSAPDEPSGTRSLYPVSRIDEYGDAEVLRYSFNSSESRIEP